MDFYLTFSDFKPTRILERYESAVWTERYSEAGDFKLVLRETEQLLGALRAYKYILSSESTDIMQIETINVENQTDGENLITVQGRSMMAFLENRSNELDYSDEFRDWGSVGGIVGELISGFLINSSDPLNNIDGLVYDGGFPDVPKVRVQHPRDDLYTLITGLLDSAGLGFKFYLKPGGTLACTTYKGLNRTNPASAAYRKFSEDLDNLVDSSLFATIQNYKNHARVLGARTTVDVYPEGTSIYVSGLDKRTIVIDASNVGTDTSRPVSEDQEILRQLGLQELNKPDRQNVRMVDGSVLPQAWDPSIGLGDIVVVEDRFGNVNNMRITERIWSLDADGIRRTPTFSQLE